MNPNERASAAKELRETVEALRRAIALLNRSDTVQGLTKELNDAVSAGDAETTETAARLLRTRLDLVTQLTKIAEDLDPHALDPSELDRLWRLPPTELVDEALFLGNFRERRMVLQAKEAETNRLLARAAIGASIVAVLVAVVDLM